jgi:aryl-alcohol dehydrogenase-like predicted oxidoreductase
MHWPDSVVPVEESLEAFDRLVRSGKVRYIGTSNDTAYGLTKANETSRYRGLARFESIQNNFSLLNRRFLDELATVCRKEKISLLPYAPLAGGVLTGKYNGEFFPPNARFTRYLQDRNPRVRAQASKYLNEKTLEATALYEEVAEMAGMSVTTLAVAWSIHHDFVASSIIGATSPKQLDDTLAALDVTLSEEVLKACDGVHEAILYPMG